MAAHNPTPETLEAAADDFRLLGDATRLRIFWTLCHEELSVAAVAERMNMTSPAVSHHLRALRDTGLVSARRDGREMRYRVAAGERCERGPGVDALVGADRHGAGDAGQNLVPEA